MSDTPVWAYKRALALANERGHTNVPCAAIDAFAAYLAIHEEPPVDPLLIEAREICARVNEPHAPVRAQGHRDGKWDDAPLTTVALAALKRGMELAESSK